MKILIVEDSEADALIITDSLSKAYPDARFTYAITAHEALSYIRENEYSCIFLDYNLPDQSGIDVLKDIYNSKTDLPPFPCVMVTGDDTQDLFMDAMILGAQDYIAKKHISPEILFLVCEKAKYLFDLKSEKNEIARKYAHTQKIKALGQLTGGIAHDFNNLLTVVMGNTHLVIEEAKTGAIDTGYLLQKMERIQDSAQKGANLVEHLMSFSRQRGQKPVSLNINHVIVDMEDLLDRTIGKTTQINYELSDRLWHTYADLNELEHLIINLCANARDAMPDGGIINIKTENLDVKQKKNGLFGLRKNEYVHLCVSDTGMGIEEEHLNKIFDPFFTTKEVGKGTGLGMSTAFAFVESCDGTINVSSQKGAGTTFDIYLPKCEEIHKEDTHASPPSKQSHGHGTILVTEDEKDIRDIAVLILENYGYNTIQAANGDEALETIKDNSIHIDMLFTDIVMPGEINGVQLAARALVLRPDLKVLFTTGYIRDHIPDINLLEEYDVLNKPYLPDEMVKLIQKILGTDDA